MMKKILLLWLAISGFASAQNADITLLRRINVQRNMKLDNTMKAITATPTWMALGIPATELALGFARHDKQLTQNALAASGTILLNGAVTFGLKAAVNRPRPFVTYPDIQKLSKAGSHSFPSGHTSLAFSTATSLVLAYPRWYVAVPAYAWAGAVGYSRMHLGVHYPSDVLVGALVGTGCALLTHKGAQWIAKRQ